MRDSLARGVNISEDLIQVTEKLSTVSDAPPKLNSILFYDFLDLRLLLVYLVNIFLRCIFASLSVNQFFKS